MTQNNSEIKIIPPRAISRESKPRDFSLEMPVSKHHSEVLAKSLDHHQALHPGDVKTDRRDFFKAVIPTSGKLLTGLFRSIGVTVATVVEETKYRNGDAEKKKSD